MNRRLPVFALWAVLAASLQPAARADSPGVFGFSLDVKGEGFFLDPTVTTITVTQVQDGMPAALAGMAAGDTIIEIEGKPVAGSKGRALEPYLHRVPGATVHLRLKHANGEVYSLTMTAVAKK